MRLLVLGGGGFLGFHAVVAGLDAGHDVTVFGRSNRAPVPGVEVLVGDREGDLGALRRAIRAGRTWDAVLDTFTDPAPGAPAVRATGELLSGAVGAYGSVSGMSVYAPDGPAWPDESAPVRRPGQPEQFDPVTPQSGHLDRSDGVELPRRDRLQERSLAKLAAERALTAVFDGPVLLPRVGIMVGPRDPTGRFAYWPRRFAAALSGRGDRRVPVPGDPARAVQFTDARDVATWVVVMLAQGRGGVFNAVGPGRWETLAQVLAACLRAAGGREGDVEPVPVDEGFLRAQLRDVDEEHRPLWYPEDQIPQAGIDSSAALAAGLRFRPAEDTARDCLADGAGSLDTPEFAARERAVLDAWAAAGSGRAGPPDPGQDDLRDGRP